MKKTLVLSLVISIGLQGFAPQGGGAEPISVTPLNQDAIRVPAHMGKISRTFLFSEEFQNSNTSKSVFVSTQKKKPMVILIADAHASIGIQSKIAEAMEYFSKEYGLKDVYVEGADQKIDLDFYRSFPDKEVLRKVARMWFYQRKLSGPEYKAIISEREFNLQGIEELALYEQNKEAALWTLKHRKELISKIKKMAEDLSELQEKYYSKKMIQFEKELKRIKKGFSPSDTMIQQFLFQLNKPLTEESQPGEVIKNWFRFLRTLNPGFVETKEESILNYYSGLLELLNQLVSLELTRNSWQALEGALLQLDEIEFLSKEFTRDASSLIVSIEDFVRQIREPLRFYRLAETRDEMLFKNLKALLKPGEMSWVIVGGFHLDGMMQRMKKDRIPYLVFTPSLKQVEKNSVKFYRNLLGEENKQNIFATLQLYSRLLRPDTRLEFIKQLITSTSNRFPDIRSWLWRNGFSSLGEPLDQELARRLFQAEIVGPEETELVFRDVNQMMFEAASLGNNNADDWMGDSRDDYWNEMEVPKWEASPNPLDEKDSDVVDRSETVSLSSSSSKIQSRIRASSPMLISRGIQQELNKMQAVEEKKLFLKELVQVYASLTDSHERYKLKEAFSMILDVELLHDWTSLFGIDDIQLRSAAIVLYDSVLSKKKTRLSTREDSYISIYIGLRGLAGDSKVDEGLLSILAPSLLSENAYTRSLVWDVFRNSGTSSERIDLVIGDLQAFYKRPAEKKKISAIQQFLILKGEQQKEPLSRRLKAVIDLGVLMTQQPLLRDLQTSADDFSRQFVLWEAAREPNLDSELIGIVFPGISDPDPMIRYLALKILIRNQISSEEFLEYLNQALVTYQEYKQITLLLNRLKKELEPIWERLLQVYSLVDANVFLSLVQQFESVVRDASVIESKVEISDLKALNQKQTALRAIQLLIKKASEGTRPARFVLPGDSELLESAQIKRIKQSALRLVKSEEGTEVFYASTIYILSVAASLGELQPDTIVLENFRKAQQRVAPVMRALSATDPGWNTYMRHRDKILSGIHSRFSQRKGNVILSLGEIPQDPENLLTLLKEIEGNVRLVVVRSEGEESLVKQYSKKNSLSTQNHADLLRLLGDTRVVVEQEGSFSNVAQDLLGTYLKETGIALVSRDEYIDQSLINLERVVLYQGKKLTQLGLDEYMELLKLVSYVGLSKNETELLVSVQDFAPFGFFQSGPLTIVELQNFLAALDFDQDLGRIFQTAA